jgi:hypothetical protein
MAAGHQHLTVWRPGVTLARMTDKPSKPDFIARPTLGKGTASVDPVLIATEDQTLPPLPDERDPKPLAKLATYNRDVQRKQDVIGRLLTTEYEYPHTARRALLAAGFSVDSFDCPYAVEQRFSSINSLRKIWKIVDDEDGRIKGEQMARKKSLVGNTYASDAAAYTALKRKGHRVSDPNCPYKIVKTSPITWKIEIKITPEEARREAANVIRSQLPLLSMPDNQETTIAFIVEQLEKIFS